MILIRRLWLAPAVLITTFLYYFFYSTVRNHAYSSIATENAKVHLAPRPELHPVSTYTPLPSGKTASIPRIQFDSSKHSETPEARATRLKRQDAVKESFLHAWKGYKRYAWTRDEVAPISGHWRDSFGGWGATLVDTMDTLWIMGLRQEFEQCVAIVKRLDFTTNTEDNLNVFETTIRYLGGLLAAYDISEKKYPILLRKAKELGDILYMAFDTPNHMPVTRWEWKKTAAGLSIDVSTGTLIAELGSLTLEFTRLSQLTHEPKYFDAVQRITQHLADAQNSTKLPGLWPTIVNAHDFDFHYNHFTFGGMADSVYEYLPKQYTLLGGLDPQYQTMYESALQAAKEHLFFQVMTPNGEKILFSGNAALIDFHKPITEPQGQHLGCFVGGMVGIGSKIFSRAEDLTIARKLVDGCIWAYKQMPTGLMPEVFFVTPCHSSTDSPSAVTGEQCVWSDEKWYKSIAARNGVSEATAQMSEVEQGQHWARIKSLQKPFIDMPDNRYILRPEAIESVFILYRITGDTSLLESAWTMFESIEKATRTEIAHAGIYDVRQNPPQKSDRMESFWLAETLKYFYLIFSEPDLVSLDDWVLNTEAHPLRRPKAGESL